MTKKLRKMLVRVLIAAALFLCLFILDKAGVFENARYPLPWLGTALHLLLAVSAYLIAGYDVLLGAARNIAKGHVFDEKFLMMIATFAAFGIGEYTEAVAVMVFYQVGEWFQGFAVGRSRRSISELMKIAPEYANVEVDGVLTECDPEQVAVGDRFVVKPGERVPLDGIVEEGDSMLDSASLTGESVPRRVRTGDEVLSGCVNLEGVLKVRATKVYEDSTVAKILELVENASQKKAPVEQFITRFAKYYTPVVTVGAVLLALIPPIFLGNWAEWIRRACTFLVISCPCALVISVPLGFFGGIGASSRIGVLVKGSTHLEMLSKIRTMAFDKTGTLTKGEFKVAKVLGADGKVLPEAEKAEMLRLLSRVETYSTHPIASAIREAAEAYRAPEAESTAKELAGRGIEALIDGKTYFAGNRKLLSEHGIEPPAIESAGTIVYLFSERTLLAAVLIEDGLKDGVKEGLRTVRASGVAKLVMLTGDRVKTAERIAEELGIDEVHAELLPGDKVETLEKLMADGKNGKVAFIGDGINDAPVLMRADLGIAMGAIGSDAAIEAADVVLMDDDVRKLGRTVKISRKTLRIVYGNIIFALFVKLAALILGAFGVATIWMAMFADVGVAFICILNAMRALRIPGGK